MHSHSHPSLLSRLRVLFLLAMTVLGTLSGLLLWWVDRLHGGVIEWTCVLKLASKDGQGLAVERHALLDKEFEVRK